MFKSNTVPLFLKKSNLNKNSQKPNSSAISTYHQHPPTNFSTFFTSSNKNHDLLNSKGPSTTAGLQIKNYERVKIVGQGSFGIAILYKRKIDNVLIVFKQINLNDLSNSEKDLAMNEVEVFSKLHHPNIISYLGSFIKDNTLLIEMEYADGGTLAHIIMNRNAKDYFAERYIISIFEQITSAIHYMHSENILHRDLKTANVFLNTRGIVKIGDFGISKIMNTKIHAQTVLGTPYYFSPEMCEGKEYDHKSDIWALGCILGEMCCLRKSFAATNLSELVAKIMSAKYNAVPPGYSNGLKSLVNNLLQVDVNRRPEAAEILEYWLPLIYRSLGKNRGYSYEHEIDLTDYPEASAMFMATAEAATKELMQADTALPEETLEKRSVLYQLKAFGSSFSLTPIQLPPTAVIKCFATSGSHFIAVNIDGSVFSWGEGSKGQLGITSLETWKHYPSRMESIRKHHVVGACAGNGFTILWTNFGTVLSCGDNSKNSLGHEENKTFYAPKQIEKLENVKIIEAAAGSDHVIALSEQGLIYTWGTNSTGALGMGSLSLNQKTPQHVMLSYLSSRPKKVFCGPDTSAILFENGVLFACGSNEYNKLGFSSRVHKIMAFKKVNLNKKIIDVSMSTSHSVFLVEGGYVITMGKNLEGQRGVGNCETIEEPSLVTGIKEKFITKVQSSDLYTVVSSNDNILTFWGTRYGLPESNCCVQNQNQNRKNSGSFQNKQKEFDMGNSTTAFTNFLASVYKSELILDPIDILALYSSKEQVDKGYYVKINNVFSLSHSILVLVETTTPLISSVEEIV